MINQPQSLEGDRSPDTTGQFMDYVLLSIRQAVGERAKSLGIGLKGKQFVISGVAYGPEGKHAVSVAAQAAIGSSYQFDNQVRVD